MKFYLACDALESVKLMPTSAPLWQRMCALMDLVTADEKSQLIDVITSLVFRSSDANWLRCSALAYLTRDPVWFARQAALAQAETPPDAIMTLLGLTWYHTLARSPDAQTFVQLLQHINAPRLQHLVANRLPALGANRTVVKAESEAGLRFAVYTPQVTGSAHGGTTFTLNMLSVLAQMGSMCQAFSAQETSIIHVNSYCGGPESLAHVAIETQSLVLYVPGKVEFVLSNTELSLRCRYEQMRAAIRDFKPDVVIFVGFMSPLVYRLFEIYPVVALSIHALPPIAPVDVWLCADPNGDEAPWSDLPTPKRVHYPFRFWPKGLAAPVDRQQLQIAASSVVLITTGSRLDTEMPASWLARMVAFIDAHPNLQWLLIGMPQDWQPMGVPTHSRIRTIPTQEALASWFPACDVYVNPPRVGGGATVAMAMEQGLPVLTLTNSDGGDKVGPWGAASMDDYFEQLSRWVGDLAARQLAGAALKVRFHERLDMSTTLAQDGLRQACYTAIESFDSRTRSHHA